MVDPAPGRVALFSIKPQYAEALMEGRKRVEFRRLPLPQDVERVVVYSTSPVQQVVGSFRVATVEQMSPVAAWDTYAECGGIEQDPFFSYYAGAESAFVIHAKDPVRAPQPFPLADLHDALRPPQSYLYLRGDALRRANELLGDVEVRQPLISRGLVRLARRASALVPSTLASGTRGSAQ